MLIATTFFQACLKTEKETTVLLVFNSDCSCCCIKLHVVITHLTTAELHVHVSSYYKKITFTLLFSVQTFVFRWDEDTIELAQMWTPKDISKEKLLNSRNISSDSK